MALFHRRSRGKDEADGEPKGAEPKGSPSAPTGRGSPSASEGATAAGGGVPPPSTSPPPHPQRSPRPPPSGPVAQKFTICFVCGSTLNAGTCPKCKMTWVE